MKKLIASLMLVAMLGFANDKPIELKLEVRVAVLEEYIKVLELQRNIISAKAQLANEDNRLAGMAQALDAKIQEIKKSLKLDDTYELNDKWQFVKKAKPAKDKN
jgi:hypothetical protein